MKLFSVDAETDGLYGVVWAIGAVVVDESGNDAVFAGQVNPDIVTDPWVRENIVPVVDLPRFTSRALLNEFWNFWMEHRDGALCLADFGAPVEAGLFRTCVEMDLKDRMWNGPYPMHELGTALLLKGYDPDINRRELAGRDDLVQHDPVDDAIAAALCWQKITA
jgi:hypothetical protein